MHKYERIAEIVSSRIRDGVYPAGKTLQTHAVLCSEFGISRSSLHKVLNILEERKMIERCQGRPCTVLDNNPRRILFVFFSSIRDYDIGGPGLANRYRTGIERFARQYGYSVTAMEGKEFSRREASFVDAFSGVILSGVFSDEQLLKILNRKRPVVALAHRHRWNIDYICADADYAGRCAAELCRRKGYRSILFVQLDFEREKRIVFMRTEHAFMDCIEAKTDRHVILYEDIARNGPTLCRLRALLRSGRYDAAVYSVNIAFALLQNDPVVAAFPTVLVDSQLPVKKRPNILVVDFDHEYNGYLAAARLHRRIYDDGTLEPICEQGPVICPPL